MFHTSRYLLEFVSGAPFGSRENPIVIEDEAGVEEQDNEMDVSDENSTIVPESDLDEGLFTFDKDSTNRIQANCLLVGIEDAEEFASELDQSVRCPVVLVCLPSC